MGEEGEPGEGGRGWRTHFAEAAETFDWPAVDTLTKEYVAHLGRSPHLDRGVAPILRLLRANLRFAQLENVADAALTHDPDGALVRLYYAQALVEGGNPALALRLYAALVREHGPGTREGLDAQGGVGRCYKEMFLACTEPGRRAEFLRRSFDAYYSAYCADDTSTYNGINAVAMAARAAYDDVPLPAASPAYRHIAAEILARLDADPDPDRWNALTAAEAHLALGRHADALDGVGAFLTAPPGPEGFEIRSFLRQLTVVWQLDTTRSGGDQMLAMLRSALLAYTGGEVTVSPTDVRARRLRKLAEPHPGLEKVLGRDGFQTFRWYVTGLTRCRAVARIQTSSGRGIGSGFLVEGAALHPALPERVLVTNAHVVPEGLAAASAVVAFHGLGEDPGSRVEVGVERTLWTEPSADGLDTTILALREYPDVSPIPISAGLPTISAENRPRAYVIGHPGGLEEPRFSLQDNLVLDHDQRVLHYRSPTEGGSSGSPVMNDDWELVALHHAGAFAMARLNGKGETYAANEGILIDRIRRRLAEHPPSP